MNTIGSRNTSMLQTDTTSVPVAPLPSVLSEESYFPPEPASLEEAGLSEVLVESLICQHLMAAGTLSGRKVAERLGMPFGIIDQQMAALRTRQIIAHARTAPLNDYYYSLTEAGQKRAVGHQKIFSYIGPAPVPLADYITSVEAQATQFEPIRREQLIASLANISYEPNWLDFLGPAVNSNCGIFLYGPPGNGKTTLAKCLTALRGEKIWIPHAILDDGLIVKLYDPAYHRADNANHNASSVCNFQSFDRRWIRIERPTVVVGGELTLDSLEIRHDTRSNTCEAPLQLKSNCGCLLIDDFGRQRVAPEDLLNRWIVPLESRLDFLTLPTGKKICMPFEQIILFSTNLKPADLVDEAFLRRVPFKIEITNPCEAEFTDLFRRACQSLGFPWRPEVIQQFIQVFYRRSGRPLRRCHARDLLMQVKSYCIYRGEPLDLRIDYLQHACRNYFGTLGTDNPQTAPQPDVRSAPSVTVPRNISSPAPMPTAVMAGGTVVANHAAGPIK